MKSIKTEPAEDRTQEPARKESTDNIEKSTTSTRHPSIVAQQFSVCEGGVPTDMYCPACREEIFGTYLPIFECPHCDVKIWRDDKGNVTSYEQKHTCPECGHSFGKWTDDPPSEFARTVRNFEQKAESAFLGLDRIVNRLFA